MKTLRHHWDLMLVVGVAAIFSAVAPLVVLYACGKDSASIGRLKALDAERRGFQAAADAKADADTITPGILILP